MRPTTTPRGEDLLLVGLKSFLSHQIVVGGVQFPKGGIIMQEEIIDTTWFSLGTSLKRPASLPLIKKSAGKSARFLQSIHLARKGALVEMGDGGSSVNFAAAENLGGESSVPGWDYRSRTKKKSAKQRHNETLARIIEFYKNGNSFRMITDDNAQMDKLKKLNGRLRTCHKRCKKCPTVCHRV